MVFAADYPFLDIFWTMLIFFMWVIWVWILITVLMDLFRRHDVGGWAKAGWSLFVIVLPFLGVFIYLITQGGRMAERRDADVRAGLQHYAGTAASNGPSDQIAKGKELLDKGAIDEAEFELLKRKALV